MGENIQQANLITGEWDETGKTPEPKPAIETIRSKFREKWGVLEGTDLCCGDCTHFIEIKWGERKYFKCEYMGVSYSQATTIRKCDKPCGLLDKVPYTKRRVKRNGE